MAREKQEESSGDVPPWMVTYSDLMTLLLTFFVLLISMSYIDERRLKDFLVTTRGSAIGEGMFNPLSSRDSRYSVQPGPMDPEVGRLEFLRQMVWEDKHLDLSVKSNRYVAIISIGEETLFEPGSSLLSEKGRYTLDRLSPELQNLGYPLLVAGHTSTLRDESQTEHYESRLSIDPQSINATWKLSLARSLAVYEYLKSKNLSGLTIMNEGFGEHRPRVENDTPENRALNRRVDLVLDRRNEREFSRRGVPAEPKKDDRYELDEFQFELDLPSPPPRSAGEQVIPIVRPESLRREEAFDPARFRLEQSGPSPFEQGSDFFDPAVTPPTNPENLGGEN